MLNRTILLIEDNVNDQKQMLRALKKSSILHDIVVMRDGETALDYLFAKGSYQRRDLHLMPEFIFLDLSLPTMDGIEVLKQIRANEDTALIPIIIFSSSKENTDLISSYKSGANSYICKPIDADRFVAVVQQTALYWIELNEIPPTIVKQSLR